MFVSSLSGLQKYQRPIIPNGIKTIVPKQNNEIKNNRIFDTI